MIDVTELNEAIKEIGVQNIYWIAETDADGGEYKCFFQIIPSVFEGYQDVVLVGYGPAYKEEGDSNE